LNLIVITVLGAVVAGIYNLMVKVTGGLLVGFTSN
jgi:branched-subunit amino acid ABC-type transport system permease component